MAIAPVMATELESKVNGGSSTNGTSAVKASQPYHTNGKVSAMDQESSRIRATYAHYEEAGIEDDGLISEDGDALQAVEESESNEAITEAMPANGGPSDPPSPSIEKERSPINRSSPDVPSNQDTTTSKNTERIAQVYSNVDRYGFFINDGTNASVLSMSGTSASSVRRRRTFQVGKRSIPKRRLTDIVKRKSTIVDVPDEKRNSATCAEKPTTDPSVRRREESRISKWDKMARKVSNKNSTIVMPMYDFPKNRKLKKRVYKGIPDAWRSAAWAAFVTNPTVQKPRSFKELSEQYPQLLQGDGTQDVQIDLDVPRTISGHILFRTRYGRGQVALFNVLRAFSIFDPDCGYCQGMGPIAATLLLYYNEVSAFAMLVYMLEMRSLREAFMHGFPGLKEAFCVQEALVQKLLPKLGAKMKQLEISPSAYGTRWYITLYNNAVPFSTQLRIWDILMYHHGADSFMTVLTAVAVALLSAHAKQFLKKDHGFEQILSTLSGFQEITDEDVFIEQVKTIISKGRRNGWISKARAQWKVKKEKGEDGW